LCHFVPILHKTSAPNKPIERAAHSSLSEGVQSQNNPTDRLALHPVMSVGASPQKVCLLLTQEHLEQGQEKRESTSEAKTHPAIDG